MTEMGKLLVKHAFLVALLLSLGLVNALAQGTDPPDSPGPQPTQPNPPDPTEIPIDGGASLLIAGGVAYGLKKLRDRRKR